MKKLLTLVIMLASSFFAQAAINDSCIIKLEPGWNLVGSSHDKIFMEIAASSTAEIISAWKWDKAKENWAFFEPTKPYYGQIYAKEKGYLFFNETFPGEGYWINAKTAGQIDTCAEQLPPSPM
jgi:hypothetical protein